LYNCAGIHDQVGERGVKRWNRVSYDDGLNRGVDACLKNRFQASYSLPKLNLACLKVLQDVSCRNAEIPVESPGLLVESP